jgi:O-acetyl-ADP-ribose deacetylase (regulator of RNase III)
MKNAGLYLVRGDITTADTDVIVNSANETLLGDDGVDGAINIAAGPELRAYCAKLGGCKVAEVKITPSFNLPYKCIIHTVGPQYGNEDGKESELLAACYRNCLIAADRMGVASISFPSISTGQYGYPISEAAEIALTTIDKYLRSESKNLKKVVIVLYPSTEFNDNNTDTFGVYLNTAKRINLPTFQIS